MAEKQQNSRGGGDWSRAIARIDVMEDDPDRHVGPQIDAAVRECVKAAKKTGKKSSVNVKLTFHPGTDARIEISADVKKALPQPPSAKVVAYADLLAGTLHDFDPQRADRGLPGVTAAPPGRAPAPAEAAGGDAE